MADRISNDELRRLVDNALPTPWSYGGCMSPDGQEWMGCSVTSSDGHEFLWMEDKAETDIPTARLIALAPALAAEVLQLRKERMDHTHQKIAGLIEWLQEDPDYIHLLPVDDVAKLREWVDAALSTPPAHVVDAVKRGGR